jgi:PAS domain S-box-containing protein
LFTGLEGGIRLTLPRILEKNGLAGAPLAESPLAMRSLKSNVARYTLALLATAIALALRWVLAPLLGYTNPYHTIWAAVAFSAWYCGLGPSIISVILGAMGVEFFFLAPIYSLAVQDPADRFGFLGFLLLSGVIVALGEVNRRAQSERFRQARLLDLANDAIIELDVRDDTIKYWNEGAEKLYGWSKADALGKPIHTLLKTVFPMSVIETKAMLMRQGNWQGELIHTKHDGTQIYVTSRWTLQESGRRTSSSWLEINRDITERKKAEQELQKAYGELENRVAERTDELRQSNQLLRLLSVQLLRSQDEERRRIARELHDGVGQYLAGIAMTLEGLRTDPSVFPVSLAHKLQEATKATNSCISEVRTMSHLLHPPLLEELGLASAVQWYVEGFAARSGIKTDIRMPEDLGRIGNEIEIVLFRVLQESLTNIYRHSGSKAATIEIGADSQQVWLQVQDEGKANGHGSREPFRPGVGITGMRERVKDLGGVLEIASGQMGSRVKAIIPLVSRSQNAAPDRNVSVGPHS